jgi:hypothetical protein
LSIHPVQVILPASVIIAVNGQFVSACDHISQDGCQTVARVSGGKQRSREDRSPSVNANGGGPPHFCQESWPEGVKDGAPAGVWTQGDEEAGPYRVPIQEAEETGYPDPETLIRANINLETEADVHRTSQRKCGMRNAECEMEEKERGLAAAGKGSPHPALYIPNWNRTFVLSYFRTPLHMMFIPHSTEPLAKL